MPYTFAFITLQNFYSFFTVILRFISLIVKKLRTNRKETVKKLSINVKAGS